MNVPPILLLVLGAAFGIGYGLFITIGWAITRYNRRKFQEREGLSYVALFDLTTGKTYDENNKVKTISLSKNILLTPAGRKINLSMYKAYIALGSSEKYPQIKSGDLILIDGSGAICYAFDIPDLKNYR